ncbi:MAG: DUF4826 family protein [Planctomycetota bacterium]|nr:DUF4826 family protein [Planctomycetota bacterium]
METPDYDDPEVDREWCLAARSEVVEYLAGTGVQHGPVGDWPAWHVAPILSIWAVESVKQPGAVGWWVIYGDIPTDYIGSAGLHHPREVLRAIAWRWKEYVDAVRGGSPPDGFAIGDGSPELIDLLEGRAGLLVEMSSDDEVWAGL